MFSSPYSILETKKIMDTLQRSFFRSISKGKHFAKELKEARCYRLLCMMVAFHLQTLTIKKKTVDMIFLLVMIFRHGNVSSSKCILVFLSKSYCKIKWDFDWKGWDWFVYFCSNKDWLKCIQGVLFT